MLIIQNGLFIHAVYFIQETDITAKVYILKKTCLIFVQMCDVTVCSNSLLHVSTCMALYAPFEQNQQ